MWMVIAGPRRPVRSAAQPRISPNTNSPANSTGRKCTAANTAATSDEHRSLVETGGERALEQPAIEQFLDDRRSDHHHGEQQQRRRPTGAVDEVLGVLGEAILAEGVGPQRLERQVDDTDHHELRTGADCQTEQVDPPER